MPVKSKVDISQNFVAFSEYMNFNLDQDQEEQDILVAQPSNRKLRVLQDNAGVAGVEAAGMEDVKDVISGIDRRLGVHINIVSENLGKMAHMVEEVRDALLDDPEPQSPNGQPKQWSKFDKLLSSIHPLIVVRLKCQIMARVHKLNA